MQTVDSITNVTRQSVYDAFGRVVTDYENGVWKRDYIYRGSLLFAAVDASGARYLLMDHQGSTRSVMNSTLIVERHDFKPFGEELGVGTGLRTTGQGYGVQNPMQQQYAMTERDSPTGLDNTWFRKLDSSAGRWTGPDPYQGSMATGDPQSFNRYTYVINDPVNWVDPTGLYWVNNATEQGNDCTFFGSVIDCSLARSILSMDGVYLYIRFYSGRVDGRYYWHIFDASAYQDDDLYKYETPREKSEREKKLSECLDESRRLAKEEAKNTPIYKLSDILPKRDDLILAGLGSGLAGYGKLKVGATVGASAATGGKSFLAAIGLKMAYKFVDHGVRNISRTNRIQTNQRYRDAECRRLYGRPRL